MWEERRGGEGAWHKLRFDHGPLPPPLLASPPPPSAPTLRTSLVAQNLLADAFQADASGSTSTWDRPIRTVTLAPCPAGGGSDEENEGEPPPPPPNKTATAAKRGPIVTSSDMGLVILPSAVYWAQPQLGRGGGGKPYVSDYRLGARGSKPCTGSSQGGDAFKEVKQKSTRLWVATLTAPPANGITATFFDPFPQKHQVRPRPPCSFWTRARVLPTHLPRARLRHPPPTPKKNLI